MIYLFFLIWAFFWSTRASSCSDSFRKCYGIEDTELAKTEVTYMRALYMHCAQVTVGDVFTTATHTPRPCTRC